MTKKENVRSSILTFKICDERESYPCHSHRLRLMFYPDLVVTPEAYMRLCISREFHSISILQDFMIIHTSRRKDQTLWTEWQLKLKIFHHWERQRGGIVLVAPLCVLARIEADILRGNGGIVRKTGETAKAKRSTKYALLTVKLQSS